MILWTNIYKLSPATIFFVLISVYLNALLEYKPENLLRNALFTIFAAHQGALEKELKREFRVKRKLFPQL